MGLAAYLTEDLICLDLESGDRDEAIRQMLQRFVRAGRLAEELLEPALQAVIDREKLGSTALGRGVALPHAKLEGLQEVLVCFAISRHGVPFNALDGQPVHRIFLVLGPQGRAEEYLEIMQRVSRLVQDDDFCRFAGQATSPAEVLELVEEMDR